MAQEEPEPLWQERQRSLTLFRPTSLTASFTFDGFSVGRQGVRTRMRTTRGRTTVRAKNFSPAGDAATEPI